MPSNEYKSGRGGPRKGAGRPSGKKRVQIGPSVLPETKAWLDRQDLSVGRAIDKLVAAGIKEQGE